MAEWHDYVADNLRTIGTYCDAETNYLYHMYANLYLNQVDNSWENWLKHSHVFNEISDPDDLKAWFRQGIQNMAEKAVARGIKLPPEYRYFEAPIITPEFVRLVIAADPAYCMNKQLTDEQAGLIAEEASESIRVNQAVIGRLVMAVSDVVERFSNLNPDWQELPEIPDEAIVRALTNGTISFYIETGNTPFVMLKCGPYVDDRIQVWNRTSAEFVNSRTPAQLVQIVRMSIDGLADMPKEYCATYQYLIDHGCFAGREGGKDND